MKKAQKGQTIFVAIFLLMLSGVFFWQRGHTTPIAAADTDQSISNGMGQLRAARPSEKKAAIASIQGQLDAFRKDDYQKATLYQSSALKRNFPSVEIFRHMIQGGYPAFAHYKTVKYGAAFADPSGRHILVGVILTGQNGVTVKATYGMVMEEKLYRVEGVSAGMPSFTMPGTVV